MSAYAAGFRSWASRASGMRNVRIAGVAILVSAAIVVSAILQGDVPRHLAAWLTAWLGLIGVVVRGATNLFFISKRYGRRLAEGRLGEVVHLNSERLARAERWFKRYGVFAIIFGRHIPGFRVPITVAAGVLRVR